ncbi:probable metal-nicotianamine transporter YSL7 [Abrus precatorius]|uniref:Probable metal-nicotianamine transporter YSL7 n=1 Tax=Abrus precatorius TaxID=3816 RepID=A0A8B8M1E1_ABRPR|nr:probable metal-nicotianamine transporter YSL7 [Abrus precatorius]
MEEEGNLKGEEAFRKTRVPKWRKQITLRSMVTSFVISVIFNFIVCKLNFTTGIVPSLNVAAGLLGFAVIKSYTALLNKCGLLRQPFTRQENTVIQTCVVASSGIAFSSGTGSYLLGMSPYIASQVNGGNTPINRKELSLGWMFGFLFVVSFVGLFSIVPLRKLMILKYNLTYPSGTATALLVNSLHTPKGAKLAKKQVSLLFKSFCGSFAFAFFQWFFTAGDSCGFSSFPTFGLQPYNRKFYFDFSSTYVGVGMICPYLVNASLLLGAIISWGILWPWIEHKKGIWYSADLPASSLSGIQGYRVFTAIAMMLGDGLYHCIIMLIRTKFRIYRFVPNPMCLAIPFYLGGYFAIDMCIGSMILFWWEKKNKQKAKDYAPALASGLICGDSLWCVPAAILSLAGTKPPICMKFLSSAVNKKVDTFLSGAQ